MKKKRLITALLLVLALMISTNASAEEQPVWEYDSYNFYLKLDGALSGDVTVPSEADGYAVNAIESNIFYNQHEITTLAMPDSLRALQSGAINSMNGLTSVTLNDGLEVIGNNNFYSCPALTSITIPASVVMFEGSVGSCENLKEIRFEGPCPLFMNKEFCFWYMPDDYVIYVPDDQLEAYAAALSDCGDGAAEHLQPSGKNAVITEKAGNEDWFVFDAATGTITGYSEYHAFVEIPASIDGVQVKAIGEDAFSGDYSLYGVVFPEGLEHIEAGAFEQACNIDYIRFPSTLRSIGDNGFFNVGAQIIEWNEGLEEIGAHAFQYDCEIILTLPSTVKTIGEGAFECSYISELYLKGDLESIGPRAFANCSLTYMVFDFYSPIDIAADAFAENDYLADLDLPWDCSMENRDAYAALLAEQCPGCVVWINNPHNAGVASTPENDPGITVIENGVWTVYNGSDADLTIWTAYDDIHVTGIGDGLFRGNQSIRSFYPHHCGWFTTIGNEAFADSSVEYVEFFGSITDIGDEAFRNCTNITELDLPESITSIGAGAFRGCTGITELTLPASLSYIGEGALDGCTSLVSLTVLCDPAILPDNLLSECYGQIEVYAAPDATNEQVARLTAMMQLPWYTPVSRVGEDRRELTQMPYAELPCDDFWYDTEYARLDRYQGYELNLYLPREAEGITLTVVGGDMLGRASYGDDYGVELPVRSLVIPENYREIPAWAFENCETLETVICYAPIENLEDFVFKGCSNLREVVFVNGVRNIGSYVFSECPSLETVYVGPCVENVSEYAFLNEDGSAAIDPNACIVDPALLPDVDSLLEAVRCEPMPTPEPTATPAPVVPVGEEGAPFFGTWALESMEMDGTVFSAADLDMVMELTLNSDGTASMSDGETTDYTTWFVADGVANVDGSALTLTDDGRLCAEEDGVKMLFARNEGDAAPVDTEPSTSAPVETDAGADDYVGTWYACYMVTGFMEGDPRTESDMQITLILNGDGTGSISFPETEDHIWYADYATGDIYFGEGDYASDMPLNLMEGGFLCYGSMDGDGNALGGYIIFSQDAEAVWSPMGIDMESRLEQKFICVSADVEGFAMDAAMLGGEYSMTFHADGTMDFVMVGTSISGLPWEQEVVLTELGEADAFVIDYYGTRLEAVCTEEGFDLNYFDAMLMHFVPAE